MTTAAHLGCCTSSQTYSESELLQVPAERLPPETGPSRTEETTPVDAANDLQLRVDPVVRTYVYPSDFTSGRRYVMLLMAALGSFLWWLAPVLGAAAIDPFIQLVLADGQIITPIVDCFDHRLANQTCEAPVNVDYYFYNITNKDEWLAGSEPPAFQQVGPYAFAAQEVRYDMQYYANWTEVAFTYHQWAEFLPDRSCQGCSLNDTITGVNRGYLQFLAAPQTGPLDPESAVIYQLTPITLSVIRDSMAVAVTVANPGSATIEEDVVKQWTDCSWLAPIAPLLGLSNPYLKEVPLPPGTSGFPFDPELCAFIPAAAKQTFDVDITPDDFVTYGVAMDYSATETFLTLAIGQSNATYLDPLAAGFVGAFLTSTRAETLAAVNAASPPAALALGLLTEDQWGVLQGYLASLVPTWGSLVMAQWLEAGRGGLLLTQPLETWLYGYEDPLLLVAAQQAAIEAGDPASYALSPWTYTPAIGLTFSSKDYPLRYFENVTGNPYNFDMLTWNSSRIGNFHPLIQQKRLVTGKEAGSVPQQAMQYRGLPFFSKRWALLNVTGVNEGVAFGSSLDKTKELLAWDSVLSRFVTISHKGEKKPAAKGVALLVYNMTEDSVVACNFTHYANWATATSFDEAAYAATFAAIPSDQYWSLMSNDTALAEYLVDSPLGGTLGQYFADADALRDRCATPDAFEGVWDMSALLACPTIYTFPHFLRASAFVSETTGSEWDPNPSEHGYSLGIEPFTGYALEGHKTYQVNHLVSATPNLYPNLWTSPGSGAVAGLSSDFATVPVFWVRMWWKATDGAALLVRILSILNDVLYYILVFVTPVSACTMLATSFYYLCFSKSAKDRRRSLRKLQTSRARTLRLARHEREMIALLERQARGSIVELPPCVPEGHSEHSEMPGADSRRQTSLPRGCDGESRLHAPHYRDGMLENEDDMLENGGAGRRDWSPRLGAAKIVPQP